MHFEQDAEMKENPVSLFRKHRHDLLNQLQLIRAYVQIGRQSDAIRIVDETARWLQSLTKWQTHCKGHAERLVFVASNCPHLILTGFDESIELSTLYVTEMEHLLLTLEASAAEKGWPPIPISIGKPVDKDGPIQMVAKLPNQKIDADIEPLIQNEACEKRVQLIVHHIHT
jgi:hypothetical protein